MSVMATVEFPLQPGKGHEFVGLLREALKDTKAYEGCESVETFVEHGDTSVVLIEYWQTVDHHKAYMEGRVETRLVEVIGPFVSGPPTAKYFDSNTA